jgi:hypothetical protein
LVFDEISPPAARWRAVIVLSKADLEHRRTKKFEPAPNEIHLTAPANPPIFPPESWRVESERSS